MGCGWECWGEGVRWLLSVMLTSAADFLFRGCVKLPSEIALDRGRPRFDGVVGVSGCRWPKLSLLSFLPSMLNVVCVVTWQRE